MMARIFLGLSALVWLPYGVFCFLDPDSLAQAAGVASQSATGTTEIRAMYGGLQAGLGALAGLSTFRPALVRPALVGLAFLCSGLFLARVLGTAASGSLSAYTAFALCFEFASAGFAFALLARTAEITAA